MLSKTFYLRAHITLLVYITCFFLIVSCHTVSIPARDRDAAPLITITAIDRTHNTSTSHKVDHDQVSVAPGTQMQFMVVARNELGGVKTLTFKMPDEMNPYRTDGLPDGSGKVPVQLQIATHNNQAITKTSAQPGSTYEVIAMAVNHNNMLNTISLKVYVYKPDDLLNKSCGDFVFTPKSEQPSNFPVPKMSITLKFSLDPAKCSCACQQVAFIQMIRFKDLDDASGNYFQPNDEQDSRMVRGNPNPLFNGWSIDRADGMKWPYYARYNDGTWDDPAHDPGGFFGLDWHVKPGSNNSEAIMRDGINNEKSNYGVDVVSVPICIGSSCAGQILGYFGFSFNRLNNSGVLTTPTQNTYSWMPEAFDLAIANWNNQSGKEKVIVKRIP